MKLSEADIEVIQCDPGAFYYVAGRVPFRAFRKIVHDIEGWGPREPLPGRVRYRRLRLRAYQDTDGDEYTHIAYPPKGSPRGRSFMATCVDTASLEETESRRPSRQPWHPRPDNFGEWVEA